MVRSTAKNHKDTTIIVNAKDYDRVIQEMQANQGSTTLETRFDLVIAAFEHTAAYDGMIANYFGTMVPAHSEDECHQDSKFPRTYNTQLVKKQDLRYGENSHQSAAFYVDLNIDEASVASATQLQGKALSYNNIADTDAALECVKEFSEPACVIVKHANPCGVAIGKDLLEAYNRAYQTDPTSAFGGIIAFNIMTGRKLTAGHQHAGSAQFEGPLHHFHRDASRAHHPDKSRIGGILQSADPGHIHSAQGTPVTDESDDLLFRLIFECGFDLREDLLVVEAQGRVSDYGHVLPPTSAGRARARRRGQACALSRTASVFRQPLIGTAPRDV